MSWVLILGLVAELFLFALILGAGNDRIVDSGDDLLDHCVCGDKRRDRDKNSNREARDKLMHKNPGNSLSAAWAAGKVARGRARRLTLLDAIDCKPRLGTGTSGGGRIRSLTTKQTDGGHIIVSRGGTHELLHTRKDPDTGLVS